VSRHDEGSQASENDQTFKTAQYIEVLKQILKDKNVDLSTFDNLSVRSDNRSASNNIDETNIQGHGDNNDDRTDCEDTQYEYDLELQSRGTDVSSITDTKYSISSRHRLFGRNREKYTQETKPDPIESPIEVGPGSKNSASKAAATILSAGGSFDSAVKTVTTIITERNKLREEGIDDDNKSVKSSRSFLSRGSRRSRKSSSSKSKKSSQSDSKSQSKESVKAWATVAVSAAASVLEAGGSRTSAQAASAAVLSTGSKSNDHINAESAGIAAAAEASAAVLATGSDQASATAAAIAVLRVSQSFTNNMNEAQAPKSITVSSSLQIGEKELNDISLTMSSESQKERNLEEASAYQSFNFRNQELSPKSISSMKSDSQSIPSVKSDSRSVASNKSKIFLRERSDEDIVPDLHEGNYHRNFGTHQMIRQPNTGDKMCRELNVSQPSESCMQNQNFDVPSRGSYAQVPRIPTPISGQHYHNSFNNNQALDPRIQPYNEKHLRDENRRIEQPHHNVEQRQQQQQHPHPHPHQYQSESHLDQNQLHNKENIENHYHNSTIQNNLEKNNMNPLEQVIPLQRSSFNAASTPHLKHSPLPKIGKSPSTSSSFSFMELIAKSSADVSEGICSVPSFMKRNLINCGSVSQTASP